MSQATLDTALDFVDAQGITTVDVTGGSPEMHPEFREFVAAVRRRGVACIDRCNPTIIEESGYEWVAPFLAENGVEIIASLPCYTADNVDSQRGAGVFATSIRALRRLNALGYGRAESSLRLNLVYNPMGATLPPSQQTLEADYKRSLYDEHGVVFNQLFTLANMPIKRFARKLMHAGELTSYTDTLIRAHREANLSDVMCRGLVSVDWRGYVYDCDFNQMLDMPAAGAGPTHLADLIDVGFDGRAIAVGSHCYACTAGQGSSCGGALN